ncbi:MAG: hypothetical protein R3A52_02950 [Polyangiales bacterium]
MPRFAWLLPLVAASLAACSDSTPATPDASTSDVATDTPVTDVTDVTDAGSDVTDAPPDDVPAQPASVVFDTSADLTQPATFWDQPWPSDTRLDAQGHPDLRGFPTRASVVRGVAEVASLRRRWSALPVAYFRFRAALSPRSLDDVISAGAASPLFFIDVDPASPERGSFIPTVARTFNEDSYLPPNTLALAPRPGFVLRPGRKYAAVVMRAANDAQGQPLALDPDFERIKSGASPGDRERAYVELFAPLWETLSMRGVDRADVAAATVFTTGDPVADLADLGDRVVARYDVDLTDLRLAAGDSPTTHPRFCQILATMRPPQFQQGTPPFNTDGRFTYGADGMPMTTTYPTVPTYGTVPVVITLPRAPMPDGGWPLVQYIHGSGGVSAQAVDRGTWRPRSSTNPCTGETDEWNGVVGCNTPGQGPAYVLAPRGFATAASAMPVNPERLPGATGLAYLNFANLGAFPFTFTQGVLEQRLFVEALGRLRIPSTLIAQCTGASLPAGATEGRLDLSRLITMGQSMGGMYTNMVGATEPTTRAVIPTGAGGFWGYMLPQTEVLPGVESLVGTLLGTRQVAFAHPTLALLELAWETAEPFVYVRRLAVSPLPNHPVRSIYEPVARGDSYFAYPVYDAIAVAYGHTQAGREVWPSMQAALTLDGRGGLVPYPVMNNRTGGPMMTPYTGAVVQYEGDGVYDPHAIYSQLDAVKYQYGCFAQSFVRTGAAVIRDPMGHAVDDACE